MWLQPQRYDFELVTRTSDQMLLADKLSRAFIPTSAESMPLPDEIAELSNLDVDRLTELRTIASAETVLRINKAAAEDDEYASLFQ